VCVFLSLAVEFLTADRINSILIKPVPDIYWKSQHKAQDYALFQAGFELVRRDAATTILLKNKGKVSKGRKASITRAKREGVTVESSTNFEEFINLENAKLLEKYGTKAVHSAKELELLHSRFPESIRLFVARKNGGIIAGGLVFQTSRVCHLQYFGTNTTGDQFGGGDLVIEAIINDCGERDLEIFDFGISTEHQGKTINEGLMRYKESFGGVTTIADFYQIKTNE
jgi:lipid II:glycine glycyltransferase (peptidoglycan interpeptide bridge formation enzyme)